MNLLLSLLLVLLAVTLLMVRNWYGVLAVLITAGRIFAVISFASPGPARAAFAYAVAWFLLFGGVRPVAELARTRTRQVRLPPGRRLASGRPGPGMSDADQLAWLTRVPAGVWVGLFALVANGRGGSSAGGCSFPGLRISSPSPRSSAETKNKHSSRTRAAYSIPERPVSTAAARTHLTPTACAFAHQVPRVNRNPDLSVISNRAG